MTLAGKLIACLSLVGQIAHSAPVITRISPLGVIPGKKTVVTFSGSGLDGATNLWTSFGGGANRITNDEFEHIRFEVTCPQSATGIHAVQLSGREGASNFQFILIDSLRAATQAEDHHSRTNAQRLAAPAAIDNAAKSEQVDYYLFSARAGESFSIEAIAHRLGSEMDPVVHVLDSTEGELAFCDDEPGVWRDARFVFTAPRDDQYLIAVHDSAYGGGSAFFYRLRLTHDSLIWYTFPLVDPSERHAAFEAIGSGQKLSGARSPANPPEAPGFTSLPALAEEEPNDARPQAQRFSFPAILNGKINQLGDVDYFSFNVSKDQKLIFQSQTRGLGSPCDLVLALKREDGKTLVQSDSNLPTDAAVTNKFAEAGTYLLEVRELSGAGRSNVPYRIKAIPFESGVTASTETNHLVLAPGKSAKIKVVFNRYEYDGPITLEISPSNLGLTIEDAIVGEGKKEAEIKLKASSELKAGTCEHFQIKINTPKTPLCFVSTKPGLRKNFPLILNSPGFLDGIFTALIKGE